MEGKDKNNKSRRAEQNVIQKKRGEFEGIESEAKVNEGENQTIGVEGIEEGKAGKKNGK